VRVDRITVRLMDLPFPDDMDPIVVEGDPEQSCQLIAFSLLLPYLEPYLIRTMKKAKPRITDPALVEDLERFNAQEGQHFKQHMKFNAVIRARGFTKLESLERDLDADYRRFSENRPLRFNLAYAEGFEALTTATARFAFEEGFDGMHPALADLFAWHLVEELEHRTVAFDVYDHLYGDYVYRLFVGLFAQWHMARFIARAAGVLIDADPTAVSRFGGRTALRARRRERLRRARSGLLPKVLRTYHPRYTPHEIPLPEGIEALQRRYSELATRTS
jgi:predicted metal-dependent hydrolase